MKLEKQIKKEARDILSTNWLPSLITMAFIFIFVFFIDYLCYWCFNITNIFSFEFLSNIFEIEILDKIILLIPNIILGLLSIVLILLLSPLFIGYIRLYYNAGIEHSYNMNNLLYYFQKNRYGKAIRMNIAFILRTLLHGILCFLPLIAFVLINMFIFKLDTTNTIFLIIKNVLLALSSIMLLIHEIKYFCAFTYFVENDSRKCKEYFEFTEKAMQDHVIDIIKLTISFIPWILLCLLILPIFYVWPYMMQSFCVSAKYLTQLQKEIMHYDESIPMYNSI